MTQSTAALATLTAASFAVGTAVATATPGPLLSTDDIAYLALARTLAGEGAAPLGPQAPYGLLYPALLAPGWLLGLGEDTMVVYARTVNAGCGALLLPTLYALVRRLTSASPGRALGAAVVGSALPALWLTSSIVWAERLLALLVAVAFLALARLRHRPTPGNAVAAAASGVALFAAHPRAAPVACLVIAAVWLPFVGAGCRRIDVSSQAPVDGGRPALPCQVRGLPRRAPAVPLTATALGAIGLVAAELARGALATAAFASAGTYDVFDLAGRRGIGRLAEMAQRSGGTLAYLVLAATALLVPGVVLLARRRPAGHVILAATAATVATAGWFLTGVDRADAWLHGRYVEVFAPVLLALGVIAVARMPKRIGLTVMVTVPVAAGIYAAWAGPGDNWLQPRAPVMMFGVEPAGAPFGTEVFEPGAAASVSLLAGLALWFGLRSPRKPLAVLVPVLFSALAAVGVLSGLRSLDQLYQGRMIGRIEATGIDLDEVGELHIDLSSASSYMASGVAWEVGFDESTVTRSEGATHLLLGPGAQPPEGASAVIEFEEGTLWLLG